MALSIQAISPRERTTAMGVYQAAYSIGMLVGPLASGFLADSCGLPAVFYLSASVSLVIAAIALLPALCKQDIARG
jgi:MFS family permease